MRGLTEALDLEWEADDITVSAVWPLFVDTPMVEGMDVAAKRRLGVRLVAQDVAGEIVGLVVPSERRIPLPRTVHRAVGVQARALLGASAMGPSWLSRAVNRRLSR